MVNLYDTVIDDAIKNFWKFDIAPEVYSSLLVGLIVSIVSIIICLLAKRADPLKKPKGLLLLAEVGVNFFENFAVKMMGPTFKGFGGFVMGIAMYLFTAFIFGLTGLPSPMTYMAIPLSLGLVSFVMIHATAVRFQKWRYFKRYVDPFPVLLPVNLLSMWAPLLSLTLRLFGNAISGMALMTIMYAALEAVNRHIFNFLPVIMDGFFQGNYNGALITPIFTGVFHLYFDLFSGFIQTTVFISLTTIYIGQEAPEDITDVQTQNLERKGGQ